MKNRNKRSGLWVFMIFAVITVCRLSILVLSTIRATANMRDEIDNLQLEINHLRETAIRQEEMIIQQRKIIEDSIQSKADQPTTIQDTEFPDRNKEERELTPIIMRVTAYDLSYESCKKYPDHPEYGITASGNKVVPWFTIAAGPELPFGTKVFIPYFKDKPNGGIFVVQDRGSAIKEKCIDVYMENNEDCMAFGVKYLDVYILD